MGSNRDELIELMEKGQVVVMSSEAFRNMRAEMRQDIRKQICSAKEAMYILDFESKAFYKHIKELECLVRPSSKKGKYVLSSIYEEAERLNKI